MSGGVKIDEFRHSPHIISEATPTADGVMSAADKAKLDGYPPTPGSALTAIKIAADPLYTAALGQTVRYNPTTGAFNTDLPPLTGSGQDISYANMSASANVLTIRGALSTPIVRTGDMTAGGGPGVSNVISGLSSVAGYVVGQTVTVAGAGLGGGLYTSTIASIDGIGLALSMNALCDTTVVGAVVTAFPRELIDAAETATMAAAYRALTLRDCGTIWKKMSQF